MPAPSTGNRRARPPDSLNFSSRLAAKLASARLIHGRAGQDFNIAPILWGTLVFVNLKAAFLSPPVAMSAFYLKGVAWKHVIINQIFAGMMPYMIIVIVCMVIM